MNFDLNTLVDKLWLNDLPYMQMGGGFLIGLAVGYALKKSIKILLFLGGGIIILLFILEHQHIIIIDKNALENTISSFGNHFREFGLFLKNRVSEYHTSSKLSAGAGFLIGLKAG